MIPAVSATSSQLVGKNWPVADIVARYPQAAPILAEYGLHCVGCSASELETLEEGCLGHGMSEEDIENLVSDLNDFIASNPTRPKLLTLTKDAALAIKQVGEREKLTSFGLAVQMDPSGTFFLEFREAPGEGDTIFRHEEAQDVAVFASPSTLQSIGGATIDFRDGKFKLDMEGQSCCQGNKDRCGC